MPILNEGMGKPQYYAMVLFAVILSFLGLWRSLLWLMEHGQYITFYYSAMSSGWLSGSLHAITGSDHLASLLPIILSQRWHSGLLYGGIWGLGHGLISFLLGFVAFGMKTVVLSNSSSAASIFREYRYLGDIASAATIVVIGIMGLLENPGGGNEEKQVAAQTNSLEQLESGVIDPAESTKEPNIVVNESSSFFLLSKITNYTAFWYNNFKMITVFVQGVVLGFSLDGLPSLAPAVVSDGHHALVFLGFYWLSTAVVMSFVACIVAETSQIVMKRKSENTVISPKLPNPSEKSEHPNELHYENRLARIASIAACLIGCGYLILSIARLILQHVYYTSDTAELSPFVQYWITALAVQSVHPIVGNADGSTTNNNDGLSSVLNDEVGGSSFVQFMQSLSTGRHDTDGSNGNILSPINGIATIDIFLMTLSILSILFAICYGLGCNSLSVWISRSRHFHMQ